MDMLYLGEVMTLDDFITCEQNGLSKLIKLSQ